MLRKTRKWIKKLRLQGEVDRNTYQESRTRFPLIAFRTERRPPLSERVALCQMDFEHTPMLGEQRKHSAAHCNRLRRTIEAASRLEIDTLVFPELAFPLRGSSEYLDLKEMVRGLPIGVIAGSLQPASTTRFELEQIWLDRSKVISRRISHIAANKQELTELQGQVPAQRLTHLNQLLEDLQAALKLDAVVRTNAASDPAAVRYYYAGIACLSESADAFLKKCVCTLEELQGRTSPGAEYGFVRSRAATFLLTSAAELVGNSHAGYEGELELLIKVLNFLAAKPQDFYRLEIDGLLNHRTSGLAIDAVIVAAYEQQNPAYHFHSARNLITRAPSAPLVLYANQARQGHTALIANRSLKGADHLDNTANPPLLLERSPEANIVYAPAHLEGFLIANLERSAPGASMELQSVNWQPL